ncbi:RNA polymerase II transcriptional coactivator KELP [Malania oleifera]|uniref:RNA polymerase II transcriptional coactivator KELP n=1 Tax=Malania oleifera TaxID=397392 RepID=UPI0025AEC3E7|nr:RNA polymerase II transcriptional coactivator KELP [Malania oleifera]
MEPELREKIEDTVLEILKSADMATITEYKVRKMASEQLGVDLSEKERKRFVRQVVEAFIKECQSKAEAELENAKGEGEAEEEEEEEDRPKRVGEKEYDDDGDLIICRISDRRRVTIQDFRGKTLVSIREYFKKDGRECPSSKGISLTAEQWTTFKKNVPAIEEAIRKMEARLM